MIYLAPVALSVRVSESLESLKGRFVDALNAWTSVKSRVTGICIEVMCRMRAVGKWNWT